MIAEQIIGRRLIVADFAADSAIVVVDIVDVAYVAYAAPTAAGVVVAIRSSQSRDRARYIARGRSTSVDCYISR